MIYFVLLRPNRRRQQAARQAHQDMLNNLGEGTKIVTIGGLHGTIVGIGRRFRHARDLPRCHRPLRPRRHREGRAGRRRRHDVVDSVSYEDDDDIVDGADLDATHADADADDAGAPPATPNTAPTDGTEAPRSSADKND